MPGSFHELLNFDLPRIDSDAVELGSVLGRGATSTAFRSTFNGKSYAAKVLKDEDQLIGNVHQSVITEVSTLSKLGHHPNVVQFHGICLDKSFRPIILMELVEGKDLERYLTQLRPGFDLGRPTIQKWSLDLLSALEYLHTRDPIIIHCDIKPANLLVSADLKSLKLTDFGIAKALERDRRLASASKTNAGSLHYQAPEILSKSGTAFYTEKSDIYSAALVIYYLLSGQRPESDVNADTRWRPTVLVAQMRWRKAADLLERMWAPDPEARPSAGVCAAAVRRMGLGRRAELRAGLSSLLPRGWLRSTLVR